MKEEGVQAVIDGAEHAFGAAILLRCIGASEAQRDAVRGEERTRCNVVEFTTIISVEALNVSLKLSANISMKGNQGSKHIRFIAKRKCPCKMGIIIKYN